MIEIDLLVFEVVAMEVSRLIVRHLGMHGTEHMMERVSGVQLFQPRLYSGIIIAFQTEPHIDATFVFVARLINHGDVFFVLIRAHPHIGRKPIGQRAMTGENDPPEPTLLCHRRIIGRQPNRVFAERSVRV